MRAAGRGRGHGRATQATVAAQAGVTTMTVSRFLRAPDLVAPETADRIRAALLHTGYTPNKSAGMLAGRRSSIVAVIVPSIAHATFSETVQSLSDGLQPYELELLLAATNYQSAREEQQIRAVLAWSPSALVVTGRKHSAAATALLQQARASRIPVVEIWDFDAREKDVVQIGFSHSRVGALMAEHLTRRGYGDLVYVDNSVPEDFRAHERGQAFVRAARKADAQVRVLPMPRLDPMAAGRAVLQQLMAQGLPRAMAFASDFPAAGAWLQAQESGINVPEQLAMLGFGDYPIAAQLGAGLSTVSVDRKSLGALCAQQVLAMLYPESVAAVAPAQREIRPRILQRGTS
ncbi:MAG: LacI family DNA-binding transcriptional regulator [Rhodoferax sp.]|nr:LacI family DNA-binding transcriptional regulator [Rhodoferax sp.]